MCYEDINAKNITVNGKNSPSANSGNKNASTLCKPLFAIRLNITKITLIRRRRGRTEAHGLVCAVVVCILIA